MIRRIFEDYASGRSSRMIAAGLNRDGVLSPRGGQWGASAINGGRSRASGILYNEAYVGKLVYNRTTFSKDPETGRRISRALPVSERVTATVESLRIISDEVWQAGKNARPAMLPCQYTMPTAATPFLRSYLLRQVRWSLYD